MSSLTPAGKFGSVAMVSMRSRGIRSSRMTSGHGRISERVRTLFFFFFVLLLWLQITFHTSHVYSLLFQSCIQCSCFPFDLLQTVAGNSCRRAIHSASYPRLNVIPAPSNNWQQSIFLRPTTRGSSSMQMLMRWD